MGHLEGKLARLNAEYTPYRLVWLKIGNEITVFKHCLVSFSIGSKYRNNVWCDVVTMDGYHLLLGRSWQYDMVAIHVR